MLCSGDDAKIEPVSSCTVDVDQQYPPTPIPAGNFYMIGACAVG